MLIHTHAHSQSYTLTPNNTQSYKLTVLSKTQPPSRLLTLTNSDIYMVIHLSMLKWSHYSYNYTHMLSWSHTFTRFEYLTHSYIYTFTWANIQSQTPIHTDSHHILFLPLYILAHSPILLNTLVLIHTERENTHTYWHWLSHMHSQ